MRAAIRPITAAFTSRFVAIGASQSPQFVHPLRIAFPHPLQTCSGVGRFTPGTSLPFTSCLFRCVSRVGIRCRVSFGEDERLDTDDDSACATYSATGATSLRHVSPVSQSLIANRDVIRQLPFRSSQKSARRRGSLWSQLRTKASHCGRQTSITSQLKEFLRGVSAWRRPISGRRPIAETARVDSDSKTE